MVSFVAMENSEEVLGLQLKSRIPFGCIKLEMPIRHPSGAVKEAVEHVILELSHDLMSYDLLRSLGEGRSQKRKRSE